jgi:hypothetical protein
MEWVLTAIFLFDYRAPLIERDPYPSLQACQKAANDFLATKPNLEYLWGRKSSDRPPHDIAASCSNRPKNFR